MLTGRFQPPSRQAVFYGKPAAEALREAMKEFWVTTAVLVTNTSLSRPGGLADEIVAAMGDACTNVVSGVRANSPREDVIRIAEALRSLEHSMARNPRDLIVETILEGYRHEHRILSGREHSDIDADMFGDLFAKAQNDGKLAAGVDVKHLSHLAGMHVSEGVRHWASGGFGDRSFAEVVTDDIAALIAGFNLKAGQ